MSRQTVGRRRLSWQAQQHLMLMFQQWGFDTRGWTKRTRETYYYQVRHAMAFLGNRSIIAARPKDLRTYLFSLPPNARTRNKARQALVAFYDFTIDDGYRDDNPASGLPRLQEPESIPKALTDEAVVRLLGAAKAFGPQIEAAVYTLAYEALRRSELLSMEWSMIDMEGEWLRIDKGKGGEPRNLPLHPEALIRLRKWRRVSDEARWVMVSPRGGGRPMSESTLTRRIRDVGSMAGVDAMHPHLFRHSAATHLLETGNNLRTVQVYLGHKNLATTTIYTKVRDVKLKETVLDMDYRGACVGGRRPVRREVGSTSGPTSQTRVLRKTT